MTRRSAERADCAEERGTAGAASASLRDILDGIDLIGQFVRAWIWRRCGKPGFRLTGTTGRAILQTMGHAASTRERILDQGLALMSQSGLEGVTLGVLADQVGMSKSGLFAHFRSKEEVQVKLLEHTAEVGAAHIIAPSMKEPEGLPRLKALVRNWFGWAPRAGLPGGCPVAAGLFEFDDVEGPVRDKILEMEAAWRGLLTKTVRDAMSRGHLRNNLDAAQFVWELCGIYLSHHAAQRFLKSPDADGRAQTAFAALLRRAAPVRRKKRPKASDK